MRLKSHIALIATTLGFIFLVINWQSARGDDSKLHAKVIPFKSGEKVQQLLDGPPGTVTMKSGYVTLAPGETVGKHSTGHNEEELVILAGRGEMIFKDGSKLEIAANQALYCPPDTEHDVKNTGTEPLRYVFIVANAAKSAH